MISLAEGDQLIGSAGCHDFAGNHPERNLSNESTYSGSRPVISAGEKGDFLAVHAAHYIPDSGNPHTHHAQASELYRCGVPDCLRHSRPGALRVGGPFQEEEKEIHLLGNTISTMKGEKR